MSKKKIKSYRLKRKQDGQYLHIIWYASLASKFEFVKNAKVATVFQEPINKKDPLDMNLLRNRSLMFLMLEHNIKMEDFEAEYFLSAPNQLWSSADQRNFNSEKRDIEEKFPNFFNKNINQ